MVVPPDTGTKGTDFNQHLGQCVFSLREIFYIAGDLICGGLESFPGDSILSA